MTVNLRCEKCGKLVIADAKPDGKTRCPFCKHRLSIPSALRNLPRPLAQ